MANKHNIPTNWKYGLPKNYEWEVHNLHAYAELKDKVAKGEKTLADLQQFEHDYREGEDQREWRWRREHIMRELAQQNVKDYQSFKDNPKEFMKKAIEMKKAISEWWFRKPKAPTKSGGKMVQNKFTGAWQQEYKPSRSLNMRTWLKAAEQGKVMPQMNPRGIPLNRKPTKDEIEESNYKKNIRNRKIFEELIKVTNNFGKGDSKPKVIPGKGAKGDNLISPNLLPNSSHYARDE